MKMSIHLGWLIELGRGADHGGSTHESEPPKAVKARSIPDAKRMVIVSVSEGSEPLSPDNPIKMATLIKKAQIR